MRSACVGVQQRFSRRGSAAGKTRAEPRVVFRERGSERGRMDGHRAPVSRAVEGGAPLFAPGARWTPTSSAARRRRKPRRQRGRRRAEGWFSTLSIEPRGKREEGTSLRGRKKEDHRGAATKGRARSEPGPSPRRWFWVGARPCGRYNRARSRRAASVSEVRAKLIPSEPRPSSTTRFRGVGLDRWPERNRNRLQPGGGRVRPGDLRRPSRGGLARRARACRTTPVE